MTLSSVSDVDDSYRMTVIEKIKGLMDEVDVIHKKEEAQLQKRLVSTETNKKAVGQYKQTKSGVPYHCFPKHDRKLFGRAGQELWFSTLWSDPDKIEPDQDKKNEAVI